MANPSAVANNAQTVTFTYSGTNLTAIAVTSFIAEHFDWTRRGSEPAGIFTQGSSV